jgi:hypothetical protein
MGLPLQLGATQALVVMGPGVRRDDEDFATKLRVDGDLSPRH